MLLLVTILFAVAGVNGKREVITDITANRDEWKFIAKFCYAEEGGWFELYPENTTPGGMFCFYSDWEGQWGLVYANRDVMSCKDKNDKAARCISVDEIMDTRKGVYLLRIQSSIPRWWFVVYSNCGGEGPSLVKRLPISYLNPDGGPYMVEFSRDMFNVPQMSLTFGIIYLCLLGLLAWSKVVAKQRDVSYEILRLCAVSICFACMQTWLKFIHFAVFDKDGVGLPGMFAFSFFLEGVAQCILIGILIDLSQGYTISTNYVPRRRFTYACLIIYLIVHVLLYVWNVYMADPAAVLYIYESVPGYAIMVIRILVLLFILKNYNETYKAEKDAERKKFYVVLGFYTTCTLLSLPLIVIIAHNSNSWDRSMIVYALENSVEITYYFLIWLIFRPWAGNNFVSVLSPLTTVPFGMNNQQQIFPELPAAGQFQGF